MLGDRAPGYSYSRVDNPTSDAFADAVAALEGPARRGRARPGVRVRHGRDQRAFLAFTHAGAHVVAPAGCYGGTWSLLRARCPGSASRPLRRHDRPRAYARRWPDRRASCGPRRSRTRRWPSPTCRRWPRSRTRPARCWWSTRPSRRRRSAARSPRRRPRHPLGHQVLRRAHRRHRRRRRRTGRSRGARTRGCGSTPGAFWRPTRRSCCAAAWRRCRCGWAGTATRRSARRRRRRAPGRRAGRLSGPARPSRSRPRRAAVRRRGRHAVRRDRH